MARRTDFEAAKACFIKAIRQSLKTDGREYKEAWEALGHLYMVQAKREPNPACAKGLWNAAALAYARLIYIDKLDNGTLDQDARMQLETLAKREENRDIFAQIIGRKDRPLREYIKQNGGYPPIPDIYGGGTEDMPRRVE